MIMCFDIETSGLDSSKDFITIIGWLDEDNGIQQITSSSKSWKTPAEAEKHMLKKFSLYFNDYIKSHSDETILLTFNGIAFDLKFIKERCTYHGIEMPKMPKKHIDLMDYAIECTGHRISKDYACRSLCNVYVPKHTDGAFAAAVYSNNNVSSSNHVETLQHNAIDLCSTMNMHNSLLSFAKYQNFLKRLGINETV